MTLWVWHVTFNVPTSTLGVVMEDAALERQLSEQGREIAALRKQLRQEVDSLNRLIEVLARLDSRQTVNDLLYSIMVATADLVRAETSSLMLVDEETNELIFEVATGQAGQDVVKYRIPPGQGIAGWVVDHGQPVIVDNPREDKRFYDGVDKAMGFETRSILAVPLIIGDRIIGVVEMINKVDAAGFGQKDVQLALAFANQASIAIDDARMRARLAGDLDTYHLLYRL